MRNRKHKMIWQGENRWLFKNVLAEKEKKSSWKIIQWDCWKDIEKLNMSELEY